MNANIETAPATLAEVADTLGFALEIITGPNAAVEPANGTSGMGEGWPHLAFAVRLLRNGREVLTTPYRMGIGHVPKGQMYLDSPGHLSLLEKAAKQAKVAPALPDVLFSLVMDGAAYFDAETFEDWAENYGYDTDSRKAEQVWKACDETGRKLARVLSADELATLREAAANH